MSEGAMFTGQTIGRIADAVHRTESLPRSMQRAGKQAEATGARDKVFLCRRVCEVAIPPYAAMMTDGMDSDGFIRVTMPTEPNLTNIIFNDGTEFSGEEKAIAKTDGYFALAYDYATNPNNTCGTLGGSWALAPGHIGFAIISAGPAGSGVLLVRPFSAVGNVVKVPMPPVVSMTHRNATFTFQAGVQNTAWLEFSSPVSIGLVPSEYAKYKLVTESYEFGVLGSGIVAKVDVGNVVGIGSVSLELQSTAGVVSMVSQDFNESGANGSTNVHILRRDEALAPTAPFTHYRVKLGNVPSSYTEVTFVNYDAMSLYVEGDTHAPNHGG